ncbi:hypothetical protein GNF07_25705, partial [Trichormus variabilis FSR]|nr:hypothetical protein [Trichormus variabilis FSR]
MTPYSTTPETQPKPLTHPEVDAFDWESHMAKLVGLAAEPTKEVAEIAPTNQTSSAPPQEVQTEQPLASNPFAKLALVGTGTLVLVVIAGGFLSQIMSANNQKPTQNPATVSQPEAAATNFTPKPNLEQEVETLKTKLALAEQTQAVKVAQQNLRNAARVSVPQTNNPVTPLASPTTSTSAPRTVIIERPAQNPYPPAPMPVASSASPQLPPPPLAQPNSAPTPP